LNLESRKVYLNSVLVKN